MLCSCCAANVNNLDSTFSDKEARRSARKYLQKGLEKRAHKLIAHLLAHAGEPLTVLDIGGGAGAVHHELLRRGVASTAVGVDAASAYLQAARANARKLELAGRTEYHHADFALQADEFDAADVVVMDRVICCYPHLQQLLGAAATRANKFLALSFPREEWWVRLGWKLADTALTLFRSQYHPYLHAHAAIHTVAAQAGLQPVHYDRHTIWQIAVFERM